MDKEKERDMIESLADFVIRVANGNRTLDKLLEKVKINLNKNLQRALATGGMVIKPLNDSQVQFVAAGCFIPIEYDADGRLLDVAFPECKKLGGKYYTRISLSGFP